MILITSPSEFYFIIFFLFYCQFLLFSFHCLRKKKKTKPLGRIVLYCLVFAWSFQQGYELLWVRNSEGRLVKVNFLQVPDSGLNLNFDQMEHKEGKQHNQYPVERNPNAYRSMRDYRHRPWVSASSCMVPLTNAPHGSTYNPNWGNHPNFSWKSRPSQYTPPAPPHHASTPQPPQPPQLTSSVEQAILNLSKLVDTFVEEQKAVNVQLTQCVEEHKEVNV